MAWSMAALPYNQEAFDVFTVVHFGAGVVKGAIGTPWWLALTLATFWEIIEDRLKETHPSWFPHSEPDSFRNSVIDVAAVMAGWAAGHKGRQLIQRRLPERSAT
jgi:hypothetical protein